jgi:hypothetical protein
LQLLSTDDQTETFEERDEIMGDVYQHMSDCYDGLFENFYERLFSRRRMIERYAAYDSVGTGFMHIYLACVMSRVISLVFYMVCFSESLAPMMLLPDYPVNTLRELDRAWPTSLEIEYVPKGRRIVVKSESRPARMTFVGNEDSETRVGHYLYTTTMGYFEMTNYLSGDLSGGISPMPWGARKETVPLDPEDYMPDRSLLHINAPSQQIRLLPGTSSLSISFFPDHMVYASDAFGIRKVGYREYYQFFRHMMAGICSQKFRDAHDSPGQRESYYHCDKDTLKAALGREEIAAKAVSTNVFRWFKTSFFPFVKILIEFVLHIWWQAAVYCVMVWYMMAPLRPKTNTENFNRKVTFSRCFIVYSYTIAPYIMISAIVQRLIFVFTDYGKAVVNQTLVDNVVDDMEYDTYVLVLFWLYIFIKCVMNARVAIPDINIPELYPEESARGRREAEEGRARRQAVAEEMIERAETEAGGRPGVDNSNPGGGRQGTGRLSEGEGKEMGKETATAAKRPAVEDASAGGDDEGSGRSVKEEGPGVESSNPGGGKEASTTPERLAAALDRAELDRMRATTSVMRNESKVLKEESKALKEESKVLKEDYRKMESLYKETKAELESATLQHRATVQGLRTTMAEMETRHLKKQKEEEVTVLAMLQKEKELLQLLEKIKEENKALSERQNKISRYYDDMKSKFEEEKRRNLRTTVYENGAGEEPKRTFAHNSSGGDVVGVDNASENDPDDSFFQLQDRLAQLREAVVELLQAEKQGDAENDIGRAGEDTICEEEIKEKLKQLREAASILMMEQSRVQNATLSLLSDEDVSKEDPPQDQIAEEGITRGASSQHADSFAGGNPGEEGGSVAEINLPNSNGTELERVDPEVQPLSLDEVLNISVPMGREYLSTTQDRHESFQQHKEKLRIYAQARYMWKNNVDVEEEGFAESNMGVSNESIEIIRGAVNHAANSDD